MQHYRKLCSDTAVIGLCKTLLEKTNTGFCTKVRGRNSYDGSWM